MTLETKKVESYQIPSVLPIVAPFPKAMNVELTNACNLACEFCNHEQMKRSISFLSFPVYAKVIRSALKLGVENLGLVGCGESLLHTDVFKCISYAKAQGMKYVYLTTNGGSLTHEKCDKLLASGLDSIKFSIDAASPGIYRKVKKGTANWEKLIDNILYLTVRCIVERSHLKIYGSFVVTRNNFIDLLHYHDVFKGLLDKSSFCYASNQGGQKLTYNVERKDPCSLLWNKFIVTAEGFLTACCVDFDEQLVYANLRHESLKKAWNNIKMQHLRTLHSSGHLQSIAMCGHCEQVEEFYE